MSRVQFCHSMDTRAHFPHPMANRTHFSHSMVRMIHHISWWFPGHTIYIALGSQQDTLISHGGQQDTFSHSGFNRIHLTRSAVHHRIPFLSGVTWFNFNGYQQRCAAGLSSFDVLIHTSSKIPCQQNMNWKWCKWYLYSKCWNKNNAAGRRYNLLHHGQKPCPRSNIYNQRLWNILWTKNQYRQDKGQSYWPCQLIPFLH